MYEKAVHFGVMIDAGEHNNFFLNSNKPILKKSHHSKQVDSTERFM